MELNKLTQELFEQGYTEKNHPDYVRSFNKFNGGFEYTPEYQSTLLFATPCGLHIKGNYFVGGGMGYMGVDWKVENNNPVINCPFKKDDCALKSTLLSEPSGGGLSKICFCNCHKIDGKYNYEKSLDKIVDLEAEKRQKQFELFSKKKNNRVCSLMCCYDEWTEEWKQIYNPVMCASNSCSYCSILKRNLSTVKGNVFYDVVTRFRVEQGEGFLYESKITTHIVKGKKFLSRNVPIDICEIIARTCKREIIEKERSRHYTDLYFAEYHGKFFEIEIVNIRAERRETRDLLSDLRDISEGITVVHSSDIEANKKEQKRENAHKSLESRKRKYLKMLTEKPLSEIDILYRRRIEKFLDKGIITWTEMQEARNSKTEEYEQLTFESEE